jgi:hypothetical protein
VNGREAAKAADRGKDWITQQLKRGRISAKRRRADGGKGDELYFDEVNARRALLVAQLEDEGRSGIEIDLLLGVDPDRTGAPRSADMVTEIRTLRESLEAGEVLMTERSDQRERREAPGRDETAAESIVRRFEMAKRDAIGAGRKPVSFSTYCEGLKGSSIWAMYLAENEEGTPESKRAAKILSDREVGGALHLREGMRR